MVAAERSSPKNGGGSAQNIQKAEALSRTMAKGPRDDKLELCGRKHLVLGKRNGAISHSAQKSSHIADSGRSHPGVRRPRLAVDY